MSKIKAGSFPVLIYLLAYVGNDTEKQTRLFSVLTEGGKRKDGYTDTGD